jgi:hypothetical protein
MSSASAPSSSDPYNPSATNIEERVAVYDPESNEWEDEDDDDMDFEPAPEAFEEDEEEEEEETDYHGII